MSGSADHLMERINRARSGLQTANGLLSEAQEMLGQPKDEASEPRETEKKGLLDKLKDKVKNVSLSDVGHTALVVAGVVPVLGVAADGINAGWYAVQRDWKNAALSAAAAVPGAGDAATAAKLGIKAKNAVRAADTATDASRAGDKANKWTDAKRRAAWKRLAEDPDSPLLPEQRQEIEDRGWRGPRWYNPITKKWETMELSHEPIPRREGGTELVPRDPRDHAAIDPHRHLPKDERDLSEAQRNAIREEFWKRPEYRDYDPRTWRGGS